MATKTVQTRIKNKIDWLANWQSSTAPLLAGEIALVRVATGENYVNPVTGKSEPVVELLLKVGDGTTAFNALPWLSAKASDVYDWAKTPSIDDVQVSVLVGNATENKKLSDWLKVVNDKATGSAADVTALSQKVDVEKVSTAIADAINQLDAADPEASGTAISFISTIKQENGKITATKASLPNASATVAGIVKLADGGAAPYSVVADVSSIQADYVRFNSTDSKLYIGESGTEEIIFDCGGAF